MKEKKLYNQIIDTIMSVVWSAIIVITLVVAFGIPAMCVTQESKAYSDEAESSEPIETTTAEVAEEITTTLTSEPTGTITVQSSSDYISFSALVDTYVTALHESGFRYYQIPEEYTKYGGSFPELVQAYLWEECKARDINYYIVVALIERESGYKPNCTGDSGDSKGYMQIQDKWHKWRMDAEGVTDLYDPYGNIRVGLNILVDLYEKYEDWTKVLMCYNMGQSGAKKCWDKGTYSTDYSRGILQRAQEIEQELKD